MSEPAEHCSYIVPMKNRVCRFLVKRGHKFCGEHAFADEDDVTSSKRVACPINPNHTVKAHQIQLHVEKKCPNRLIPCAWISKDINCIFDEQFKADELKASEFDLCQMRPIMQKVEKIYDEVVRKDLEIFNGRHSLIDIELENNPEFGATIQKHLIQQSAQLQIMQINSVFDNNSSVQRLRCNIEDLELANCPFIGESWKCHVTGVWKHLCGHATDLAINSMVRTMKGPSSDKIIFDSIMAAPCCHHKLEWSQLISKHILEHFGFDRESFIGLKLAASWAVCSIKDDPNYDPGLDYDRYDPKIMPAEDRELMGRKVKAIIEWSRMKYLQENGFSVTKLYEYVGKDITPENYLIFAKR